MNDPERMLQTFEHNFDRFWRFFWAVLIFIVCWWAMVGLAAVTLLVLFFLGYFN